MIAAVRLDEAAFFWFAIGALLTSALALTIVVGWVLMATRELREEVRAELTQFRRDLATSREIAERRWSESPNGSAEKLQREADSVPLPTQKK